MALRALVIDDEAPARARLKRLLLPYSDISVVGEAADGLSALQMIEELRPDVLFLDIEMPELDGFGVAEALQGKTEAPAIVFITAYNEYALQAFEVSALDYLVKPVAEARLAATLERIRSRQTAKPADLRQLIATLAAPKTHRRLAVLCGTKFIVFDPSEISAVIARDHYSGIILKDREILSDDSLDILESRLDTSVFIRVHRSALINVDYLKELEREGDRKYTAVLKDAKGTRVPVSRERLNDLKSKLGLE